MRLTDEIQDQFLYRGQAVYLDLAFSTVMKLQDLENDDQLSDISKISIGLQMLIKNYDEIEIPDLMTKINMYKFIVSEFISLKDEQEAQEQTPNESEKYDSGAEIFDYHEDAERLYASFLVDYNIDLIEQKHTLHWYKFIALFRGLSKDTPMKEAIYYRTVKIPAETKYNKEHVQQLRKAKKAVQLKKQTNTLQSGLAKASQFLKGSR